MGLHRSVGAINCMLKAAIENIEVYDYIQQLPPPNIYCTRITDLFKITINDLINDSQKEPSSAFH